MMSAWRLCDIKITTKHQSKNGIARRRSATAYVVFYKSVTSKVYIKRCAEGIPLGKINKIKVETPSVKSPQKAQILRGFFLPTQ